MSSKPRILVIAGPNGSGKSTITLEETVVGLYINADAIKQATNCTDLEAAQEAERLREYMLAKRADFTFETVLSTCRNLNLLERAKEAGYEICAIFVLTKNSAINVERVQSRVKKGGHDVPVKKIISRYERSIGNLARLVRIADIARIVDNSTDLPSVICEVKGTSASVFENSEWNTDEILGLLALQDGPEEARRP